MSQWVDISFAFVMVAQILIDWNANALVIKDIEDKEKAENEELKKQREFEDGKFWYYTTVCVIIYTVSGICALSSDLKTYVFVI